jgi:hypothetical protein
MPVKIVAGPSNPNEGEINQHDLFRISDDFQNFVELESIFTRPAIKTTSISIPMTIIKRLVDDKLNKPDKVDDYINIHYGLTLPDQRSCEDDFQTDISNQLTVVINRAEKSGNVIIDKSSVGDFIITAGFKSNDKSLVVLCCGNPKG